MFRHNKLIISGHKAHNLTHSLTHSLTKLLQNLKLVIPTKRIMILVFWEKSFKSKETDYSKRLANPLLASDFSFSLNTL